MAILSVIFFEPVFFEFMNQKGPIVLFWIGIVLVLQSFLFSCATPIAPDGGPRDEQPPRVDTTESTRNFQTNFVKQRIELTFDEWIKLDDPSQIVYSPPLAKNPVVSTKGKTVRLDFDETLELRDSATYTINFGEAVVDLTESNPAEDLRFVFSTGDFLDSLEISGLVVDALTNEPVEGVRFMLYENLADSVVRTELPFYFSQTGEDGRFNIKNIKEGTFKGFALKSEYDYKYDQPNEEVGFLDTFLTINTTMKDSIKVRLFVAEPELRVKEIDDKNYGILKVVFNRKPYEVDLVYELTDQTVFYEYNKDTLKVWYDQRSDSTWQFIVRQDTLLNDTIQVKEVDRDAFVQEANLRSFKPLRKNARKVIPGEQVFFEFNHPIQNFDTSLIKLYEDTSKLVVQPDLSIDSVAIRQMNIDYKWKEGIPYTLELLPNAIQDMYGLSNNDTLVQNYRIEEAKNLGIINLRVDSLDSLNTYLLELISGQSTVVDTIQISEQSSFERVFKNLSPGEYAVQITTDANANGRWDTGDYDKKQQPELIFRRKLEKLRANWEVEAKFSLKTEKF